MLKKVLFEILKNKLLILLMLVFDCIAYFDLLSINLFLVNYFCMFFLVLGVCDRLRDDLIHGGLIFLINSKISFNSLVLAEAFISVIFCSQTFLVYLIKHHQNLIIILIFIVRMFCFFSLIKMFSYIFADKIILVYVCSLISNIGIIILENHIPELVYIFLLAIICSNVYFLNKRLFNSKYFRLKISS